MWLQNLIDLLKYIQCFHIKYKSLTGGEGMFLVGVKPRVTVFSNKKHQSTTREVTSIDNT
jgi:hypothetical protein